MKLGKLFKQERIGNSWGYISQIATQTGVFITIINMFMLSATFYTTALSPWLQTQGVAIPFWIFVLAILIFLSILALLLYKFAMPSFFSVFNDQFYRHNNPLRTDIENIIKQNNKMLEKLAKVEEKIK